MRWILYYVDAARTSMSATEARAAALAGEGFSAALVASGEFGRSDLPVPVGNVSRRHLSYRVDADGRLYLTPISESNTAANGVSLSRGVEVSDSTWPVLGLSEAFYVFRC